MRQQLQPDSAVLGKPSLVLLQYARFLQRMEKNVPLRVNQEVRVVLERGLRILFNHAKDARVDLLPGVRSLHVTERSAIGA